MMYIIKGILCILGIHKLYKAIIKDNFDYLYDSTLIFGAVFLIQPII